MPGRKAGWGEGGGAVELQISEWHFESVTNHSVIIVTTVIIM